MQLFYAPDINEDVYYLSEEETFHCTRVLRLKAGNSIHLTDGMGKLFTAVIENTDRKGAMLKIVQATSDFGKKNFRLHIAIAPTKNIDRFEWFLEKATEIGIDEITPLICENSERVIIKPERLEKIIISAMKQSLKTFKPSIHPIVRINQFIEQNIDGLQNYIATCDGDNRQLLKNICQPEKKTMVLVGPEGDFSSDEVHLALKAGFVPVSLGTSRLRTETAGIVACHTINLINEK
jgi:16S rRNA (uracil1498-N3)-methyltransferase